MTDLARPVASSRNNGKLLIIPGSPAVVEQLGVGDAPSAHMQANILAQLAQLKANWPAGLVLTADVVGSQDLRWHTKNTGSLRAWGPSSTQLDGGNFLPELIARWFLHQVKIPVADSRKHLGLLNPERLTVVVIDGSAGLGPRAPLSLLPTAEQCHIWCESLLQDPSAIDLQPLSNSELSTGGIIEPNLWLELVDYRRQVTKAELIASDISLGVGRYLALWEFELDE